MFIKGLNMFFPISRFTAQSFGGGGSDLTHYFENNSGAVINTAVSIYSHGVMRVRDDSKIIINCILIYCTIRKFRRSYYN